MAAQGSSYIQSTDEDKENAWIVGRIFLSLLILLVSLALVGVGLYVSVLAIPLLASNLSAALALSFAPNWFILLIAMLPLIASVAMLWRFMQFYNAAWNEPIYLHPLVHIFHLGLAVFSVGLTVIDILQIGFIFPPIINQTAVETKENQLFAKFLFVLNVIPGLAALGLGIFLAVKLMPVLMSTATAALGIPYALAVLFGAAAVLTLIAMTQQLLSLGIRLLWTVIQANLLKVNDHWHWEQMAYALVATLGIATAGMLMSVCFWPLVNVVTPALGTPMAIFLAIAVSVSLAIFMMNLLPQLLVRLPSNLVYAKNLSEVVDPLPAYLNQAWMARKIKYLPDKIGITVEDSQKFPHKKL